MIKFAGAVSVVLMALSTVSLARKEETLQELVARAEAAAPDKQPDLYMEAADRQRQAANGAVKDGNWEEFRKDLKDVVGYCDKAHRISIDSNKSLKNTEIRIRRISAHLKEAKFDVDVDDQATVQTAIDQLEEFRTELLRKMFEGKRHD